MQTDRSLTLPDWFGRAAAAGLSRAHWTEQARRAKAAANARPASDIHGFCEAMHDRAIFMRLAEQAS